MYYIDISRKIGADIGLESNSQVLKQNKKKKKAFQDILTVCSTMPSVSQSQIHSRVH